MHCTKFPCRSKNVHALGAGCNVFRQIDKEKSKKKKERRERDSHVGLVQVGHGQASLYHRLIHGATCQPAEIVADDDRPEGVSRRRI